MSSSSRRRASYQHDVEMRVIFIILFWAMYNTSRPRQHGRHFPDNIIKVIFFCEICYILIKFSLQFVPHDPINIVSDNGSAPKRQQAIIWSNVGMSYWRIYASFLNDLSNIGLHALTE